MHCVKLFIKKWAIMNNYYDNYYNVKEFWQLFKYKYILKQ